MSIGIRGKIVLLSLALITAAGLASGIVLEAQLRDWLEERLVAELVGYAASARVLVERSPAMSIEAIEPLADSVGEAIGARVTVIAADGRVLGDSELSRAEVHTVENHGKRPEVLTALEHGLGVSRRYSTTLRTDMLYVAVPSRVQGGAAVRVAMPLSEVDALIERVRIAVVLAWLLGLAIAVTVSAATAQLLSRRLRGLAAHARAVTRGSGGPEQPLGRASDEVGRLADSFQRITAELDRTVAELAADRDRLETILTGMSNGVVALDDDDRVALTNPAARQLLRLAEAPDGRLLLEAVRLPALVELVAQVRRREATELELEVDAGSESARTLLARGAPMQVTGGVVLVLHDVTELRRLERVRRDFVANVSHELRTPVSVIRANAETLVSGGLDDKERGPEFAAAILRNAERLAALISDLLDLARLESGAMQRSIETVDIAEAAGRAVEVVTQRAAERNIDLSVEIPDGLQVRADSRALGQILLNLVDNAVKYIGEGGTVVVRAIRAEDAVRLEVVDDGPGIAPQVRERVFERFYRADPGRSREMGGTGLGLSIVKHLAEAMDGSVGVEPVVPHGSRFWVSLPVVA